jgi:hypothetical protein
MKLTKEQEEEFPSPIAMEVTDIILNKEPDWSRKLEIALQNWIPRQNQ